MLFNNLSTQRRASLIVKNSAFYIEIAKFVQAYTTIVKNPNEFLNEVGEKPIDEKKHHLKWEQLVKIMQTCDLGFKTIPTRMDLVVYYNYALEMGSVKALEKKIASVDDVAEAQKHYYNFVDEEKTVAEEEYLKQKKIYEARQREMDYVDGQISAIRAKNWLTVIMMLVSVFIGMFGVVCFFVENKIATTVGGLIPVWKANYVAGIIFIVVMILLFMLFNKFYVKTKYDLVKLKNASVTLFIREDEMYLKQEILKKKLDEVNKDYQVVLREMKDKTKKFDVKHNIEVLKSTNKFYQKLCETEELGIIAEKAVLDAGSDDDFAPIKLSKEQEENIRAAKKEVIGLSGQIDMDAYYEKFEKSDKKKKDSKEEESEKEEMSEDASNTDETKKLNEELEKQKRAQDQEIFKNSVNFAKDLLGMNSNSKDNEK